MQGVHQDLYRAREAALSCVRAVGSAFECVYRCADATTFLRALTALEEGLVRADEDVAPLLDEFGRANQHAPGPSCAGVVVESAPPSAHALASEVARKLLSTMTPVRRLAADKLHEALLELHKELLSVMAGANALEQLTQAKFVLSSELDTLRSRIWTESAMAEVLRARAPGARQAPAAPSAAGKDRRPPARAARAGRAGKAGCPREAARPKKAGRARKRRG